MAYKLINDCPVCGEQLKAVKLNCSVCGTTIENEFNLSRFGKLNTEQLDFVEIFLKCRGSIKDVEKEMNISYPTVKGKLNDVIKALGYDVQDDKTEEQTGSIKSVIDSLEQGDISAEEALKKINEKSKRK